MPSETVLYEITDHGVAILTLNNPERRNALSSETLAALERLLAQLANDSERPSGSHPFARASVQLRTRPQRAGQRRR